MLQITFTKWEEILLITPEIAETFVFRGQSYEGWHLATRQERNFSTSSAVKSEENLVRAFDSIFPSSLVNSKKSAFVEFLLNRHYSGEHLRFLDFSESFLVALYFALLEEGSSKSAVFAVNKNLLFTESFEHLRNEEKRSSFSVSELIVEEKEFLYDIVSKKKTDLGFLYLRPLKNNKQQLAQQTVHLVPKQINIPFSRNFQDLAVEVKKASEIDKYLYLYPVIKFIIPSTLRSEIIKYFQMTNISDKTLLL